MNNCISHIEGILIIDIETFKNFLANQEIKLDVSNNNILNTEITFKAKELEISNRIEEYVLKLVGRDVIIMDKIAFFLNKIIIILLILIFLNRFDMPTVRWSYKILVAI